MTIPAINNSVLRGPAFGSYRADEVGWLLTDLSDYELEADIAQREKDIQTGRAHYAESLPHEYQPNSGYQNLFEQVLTTTAARVAAAVARVTDMVIAERGYDSVLVSLARAGTPVGVLMRRWAAYAHAITLPHFAVSIVRDRGIDQAAIAWLADRYTPGSLVFVDGWTGKGAIARELEAALGELAAQGGPRCNADLAVLADPGHCVRTYGTRDDFLIASACLNSTVSGLVSRTVLNRTILAPGEFHGAKFYRTLAEDDVSNHFLDTISAHFPTIMPEPAPIESERTPTWAGWNSVERIADEYGISSVNFVKPGVGETTRVLLRRVPWKVLVRDMNSPDIAHIMVLARARGVVVEVVESLPYACVGLIKESP